MDKLTWNDGIMATEAHFIRGFQRHRWSQESYLCKGAQRKHSPRKLLLRQVCQEVCLVFNGVWRQRKPDLAG